MGATSFTPAQISAIEFLRRDACVVAGPGSGKTTVLVERYRRLIEDHNFEPRQILAITFTEKAAANMKAKLAAQFSHDAVRLRDLESSWVSTIHGFCARLLRENAIVGGLDPRFAVLSPRESDNLQWECLNGALDELTEHRRTETLELIEALQSPYLAGDLKDIYDAIRSAGMTIEEVRGMPNPAVSGAVSNDMAGELREILRAWPFGISAVQREEKTRLLDWCNEFESAGEMDFATFLAFKGRLKVNLRRVPPAFKDALEELREMRGATAAAVDRHATPFRALIFDVLERFDEDYRNRKNALSRVDFNDLERHAIALLKNSPDIRRRVHEQFRQVMLDEYQDINNQQGELIALLRAEDVLFGVGDINQSIYGFRHARPDIFRAYHAEVIFRAGQSAELLHNFRSREAILRCVREVLANEEGIEDRELVAGAIFAAKEVPSIEVLKVLDAEVDKDAASEREAAWIAHRVRELCGTLQLGTPGETRPAEFRDFAVLCRNGDSMPPILGAFERAGIPYICGRRQSFLLSREGLDITMLLRVISNPRDSISLAGLLRGPLVGISDEGLLRLRLSVGSLTSGLNKFAHNPEPQMAIDEPDATKLTSFCRNLNRWRTDQPIVPLDILLARALSDCGVHWTAASVAGANIESFLHLARTAGAAMDLPAFLQEVESLADAAGTESELSDEDQGNCIQVMTAHAAKGLEFPVTIIAAMDKGSRRESKPVTFTQQHGLGVKWRNPVSKDGKDGLKDSWAEANKTALREREREEENRLLYVAMTRAEEHLILSYSRGKSRPANWAGLIESRFNLSQLEPSSQPIREKRDGYEISILVTDADPPRPVQAAGDAPGSAVEMIARPLIEDQHETSVAVTSLAVFGACPRKYYIQRSLGWNTGRFRRFDPDDISADDADVADDEPDLPAARIGSAVHQILAGLKPTDDDPEAHRLAAVFSRSELGQRAAASPRAAREWAFIAEIGGTILRGTIDLWFENNGEIHLVDYKTDDVTSAAAPIRALDYAPQLALYGLALERGLGKRPKVASLHFLRPDAVVGIPLDDNAIANARALVGQLRQAQNELRFDLNEGGHCRSCQFYRSMCPAGQTRRPDAILEIV
jgi:ATP-dependent helicase/nuclease subunit A